MFPRRWQQQVEWPACLIAFRVQWRGKMTRKLRSQHRKEEAKKKMTSMDCCQVQILIPRFSNWRVLPTPAGNPARWKWPSRRRVYSQRTFWFGAFISTKVTQGFPPFLPTCVFLCLGPFFFTLGRFWCVRTTADHMCNTCKPLLLAWRLRW